jgi:hypothetical protein
MGGESIHHMENRTFMHHDQLITACPGTRWGTNHYEEVTVYLHEGEPTSPMRYHAVIRVPVQTFRLSDEAFALAMTTILDTMRYFVFAYKRDSFEAAYSIGGEFPTLEAAEAAAIKYKKTHPLPPDTWFITCRALPREVPAVVWLGEAMPVTISPASRNGEFEYIEFQSPLHLQIFVEVAQPNNITYTVISRSKIKVKMGLANYLMRRVNPLHLQILAKDES